MTRAAQLWLLEIALGSLKHSELYGREICLGPLTVLPACLRGGLGAILDQFVWDFGSGK